MTGLFGGAFDPPHNGHVALVQAAVRHFSLDRLVVLVVAEPGHKAVYADADARVRLARAAFPGYEVELDRHPRTVDMLRERGWDDPLFLIGADELADFPEWKEPEAVLELTRLGVATRPGYPREPLGRPDRVLFFEIEPLPVSSTEVRERVARGEPIDDLVPPAVAALIEGEGLYRSYT